MMIVYGIELLLGWIFAGWYLMHHIDGYEGKAKKILSAAMIVITLIEAVVLVKVYPSNAMMQNIRILWLSVLLWPIAANDHREHKIPNKLLAAGMVFWMASEVAEAFLDSKDALRNLLSGGLAAVVVFVLCLVCMLIVRNGVGMGDAKLLAVMGMLEGLTGLYTSLFYSLITAFFMACYLLLFKKKGRKDVMAFGPAILIGTVISVMLSGA